MWDGTAVLLTAEVDEHVFAWRSRMIGLPYCSVNSNAVCNQGSGTEVEIQDLGSTQSQRA